MLSWQLDLQVWRRLWAKYEPEKSTWQLSACRWNKKPWNRDWERAAQKLKMHTPERSVSASRGGAAAGAEWLALPVLPAGTARRGPRAEQAEGVTNLSKNNSVENAVQGAWEEAPERTRGHSGPAGETQAGKGHCMKKEVGWTVLVTLCLFVLR